MPTQKKRFSIKTRMVIIFGLLLAASLIVLSFLEMYRSYKALMETVEAHLIDKTSDAAALIDSEMRQWFKLLDGIAMQPILCDATVSYRAKAVFLKKLAAVEASIIKLSLVDTNGKYYLADGQVLDASGTQWFKDSQRGTQCVFSAPFKSVETGELVTVIAVPIKEESGSTVDILVAVIDGFELCNFSDEIVVGKTGNCFITDKQGVVIADSDRTLVEQGFNVDVEFRKNQSLASLFGFLDKLYRSNEKTVTDYYTSPSSGSKMIACGATTKINEWKLTAVAPVSDFLSALNALRSSVTIIVTLMILVAIIIVYVVARSIVNPISRTAGVLRDIAQGEGDLTVRLPVLGN
ncbi:MAG: cache domain-containing protein, partial [Treponema sp.]